MTDVCRYPSARRCCADAVATRTCLVATAPVRHGLARALSKRGICSRSEAARWIAAGRVSVGGQVVRDPEFPTTRTSAILPSTASRWLRHNACYIALNKPRGLVTTTHRRTRPRHGLSLLRRRRHCRGWRRSGAWTRRAKDCCCSATTRNGPPRHRSGDAAPTRPITCRSTGFRTTPLLAALVEGVDAATAIGCARASSRLLRAGESNAWLEIVLDEGRNRQIRRLLGAFDIGVLRLVRVAIGALALGELPKGAWRMLDEDEVRALVARTLTARANDASRDRARFRPSARQVRGRSGRRHRSRGPAVRACARRDICVRMRAWPLGTTGKKNPIA